MRVPESCIEVLPGDCPIAGDPDEVLGAAARLSELMARAHEYAEAVRFAQASLSANQSLTVRALDAALGSQLLQAAEVVLSAAEAGRFEFTSYVEQVEEVHAHARFIMQSVTDHLRVIRACGAHAEMILAVLNSETTLHWQSPVPLEIPLASAAGLEAQDQAIRRKYEGEWRTASLRWRGALGELQLLCARWQSLTRNRVEIENHLANALRGALSGSGIQVAGGGASGALPLGPVGAFPAKRDSSPINPAERRTHPLLAGLYRDRLLQTMVTGRPPSADQVAAWWRSLSEGDRRTLIEQVPLVVGNLDGVPLKSRIAANAVSAQHFAGAERVSDEEAGYWRRVAAGSIKLVVSDPSRSRVVEMVGELGPNVRQVITFLPGTTSQMKHFYSGEAQQVSKYLVARSESGSVAFVYKDGSWVSWLGPTANTNYDRLQSLGDGVAAFQSQVLDREPGLQGSTRVAIAHSAGMSVASGAQIAGAGFDIVISLGGAFVLREWRPDPETDYHHFQYDNDAINLIDDGRLFTPHELTEVFEQHIFDSEGLSRVTNHSRIAQGPESNRGALEDMFNTLEGEQ